MKGSTASWRQGSWAWTRNQARRGYYPYRSSFPFVQGYEVAGVVDAVGPGVTGFAKGDRVAALTVAQKRIQPRIVARLPLLAGRKAQEMLEAGGVGGKIVLVA